ncbi:MAG: hypothetical protein Q9202_006839 [Teloschistes flavicans]
MVEEEGNYASASFHELGIPLAHDVSPANAPEQMRTPDNSMRRSLSFENERLNPFGDSRSYLRRLSSAHDSASDRSSGPIPLHSLSSATKPRDQKRQNPRLRSEDRPEDDAGTQSGRMFQKEDSGWLRTVVSHPWLLEIVSSFIAALALLAIIVTLAIHQGRPLPQWPHLISINALIAVFTTIFKASLLMPVAEASVAIDPFSQQVINYYECQRPSSSDVASIPRANHYVVNGTRPSTLDEPFLDNDMVVAVYLGLLKPPTNSSTSVSSRCSTGNCTFPADSGASYQSLAMCYSCSDINATVKAGSQSGEAFLPSDIPPDAAIDNDVTMAIRPTAGAPRDANLIFSFESLIRLDDGRPWAFRCSLNACVKTYSANISESNLEEHTLETQPVLYDQRVDSYILATNRTLRNGTWNDCISTTQRTDTNTIAYPFHTDPSPNYGSTFSDQDNPNYNNGSFQFYPPDCLWSYGDNAAYALEAALRRQFFNVRNLTAVHDDFYAPQSIDPAWLIKLYNDGKANIDTVNSYMAGLAEAITANMRERGELLPSGDAKGTTHGSQTCIGARWAWLSLPATMFVLTVIFLAATIAQTRTPVAWKSSATALLFHGFDDATRKVQGGAGDIYGVKSAVEHMRARVEHIGADGWRFVKVE